MVQEKKLNNIDMALSCSLFLEGALKKYKKYAVSVDADMMRVIREWNRVLLSVLKEKSYDKLLGTVGQKLIINVHKYQDFVLRCVDDAYDVAVQSLHYALRFQENVQYLKGKYNSGSDIVFCDLGCGFSPLSVAFQNEYDLSNVYCIDVVPEIADIYTIVANKMCNKAPEFIDWESAQKMAIDGDINTLNAVGCLPHMPLDMQKKYMLAVNKKFPNFFLEIKYKTQDMVPNSKQAFSLLDLQKIKIDVKNVSDVETAMIGSSIRYMFRFVHSKPDRINDFLVERTRSLFLSR